MVSVISESFARPPADYSWSSVELGFSGNLNTITGTSYDNLYFLNNNAIYQWNGSAGAWQELSSFTTFLNNSSFENPSVIAAVNNQIYVGGASSNGRHAYFNGSTWSHTTSGSGVFYNGVYAYEIQVDTGAGTVGQVVNVYARGTGRIFRLVDGASNNSPLQSGPAYTGGGIAWQAIHGSPSDNVMWAVGQQSQIGRSTNSGQLDTWSGVVAPVSNTFFSTVHVLDGDTAIIGSDSRGGGTAGVWYTTDAGDTWVDTELNGSNVLQVYATSLNDIWAVGNGLASHYDGNSWTDFADIAGISSTDILRTIHVLGDQVWIGGRDAAGNAVLYTGTIPEPASVGLIIGVLGLLVYRSKRVFTK